MKYIAFLSVIAADFATKWAMRGNDVHNYGIHRFDGLVLVGVVALYVAFYAAVFTILVKSKGVAAIGVGLAAGGFCGNSLQFIWQGSATDWIRIPLPQSDLFAWTNAADILSGIGVLIAYTSFIRFCIRMERRGKVWNDALHSV